MDNDYNHRRLPLRFLLGSSNGDIGSASGCDGDKDPWGRLGNYRLMAEEIGRYESGVLTKAESLSADPKAPVRGHYALRLDHVWLDWYSRSRMMPRLRGQSLRRIRIRNISLDSSSFFSNRTSNSVTSVAFTMRASEIDQHLQRHDVPTRQPACDACRQRKVRCDKLSPCSSCKASDIPCRTTREMPGRRTRIQVPRSQTGNRYEQTIADLQSKVEQLSQSLQARSGAGNGTPSAVNSPHARPDVPTESIGDRGSSFEGDSSFMTHSKQVTQAFEASLASTPQIDVDDALSGAVANLHKALDSSNAPSMTPAYSAESPEHDDCHGLSNLPLPPSDVVLKLLKRAKGIS